MKFFSLFSSSPFYVVDFIITMETEMSDDIV